MGGAVVVVEGAGAEVAGFDGFADEVGFANPGALSVGENYRDGMASGLELSDEGVDVGRGFLRGWAIVIGDL